MGGVSMKLFVVLFFSVLVMPFISAAEGGFASETDCFALCAAGDYGAAADCFKNSRSDADAYLATAHCALNNYADPEAESFALKSADERLKWIRFVRNIPGVTQKIRTGGTAEAYMTAYVASGGSRYRSQSIEYAKTSGQCQAAEDPLVCAELYFNSYTSRVSSRSMVTGRNTNPNMNRLAVEGVIKDDITGSVLKNVKVNLKCAGAEYITYTDAEGKYKIPITSNMTPCREARLYIKLQYHDPLDRNKIYFRIIYRDLPVWMMKKFSVNSKADLKQDFILSNATLLGANTFSYPTNKRSMPHFLYNYKHMTEVLEFYRDFLKVNVDYKLPVDVKTFVQNSGTYYTPATATIVIDKKDSKYTSSNRPMNREWHEFSHHVMFAMYKKWPQGGRSFGIGIQNHDGFNNPSTSDSFMEGFAEYMSMAIADHYRYPHPEVYAGFGSWERNLKPWFYEGMGEEMAIAGILWDLYDAKNDEQVDLDFDQIWNVIKVYHDDFGDVWQAFNDKFPGFKNEINQTWEIHGFWSDQTRGDGVYQIGEAFRDLNKDNVRQANEAFTDYAEEPGLGLPWFVHQSNETVGYATNYERPARRNTARAPANYVKTKTNYPSFNVRVMYADGTEVSYLADNVDGMVYVQMPGFDDPATFTVWAAGVNTPKPLTIKSEDFYSDYAEIQEQGFIVEHDFGIADVEDEGPDAVPIEESLSSAEETPYWETADLEATAADFIYTAPVEYDLPREDAIAEWEKNPPVVEKRVVDYSEPSSFPWPIVIVVVLIAGVLFLILRKRKKKSHRR